jgi:hypothetical protein
MNRILSFGVLLFSFALVMLGYQPSQTPVSTTFIPPFEFSLVEYRVIGLVAIFASLLFFIMAGKRTWSAIAEKWLNYPWLYPLWGTIFEGLYILGFLKGFVSIVKVSPPAWVVNTVFYFGFVLAIYIIYVFYKYAPMGKRKVITQKS